MEKHNKEMIKHFEEKLRFLEMLKQLKFITIDEAIISQKQIIEGYKNEQV